MNVPVAYNSSVAHPWPPRLPFDLALGESQDRLCAIYGLTLDQLLTIQANPAFKQELAKCEKEVSEHGITFKRKAALQAEMYLEEIHDLVTSPETPASVRLAAIQSVTKWGGLEPKESKGDVNTQNNVKIEITWGTPPPLPLQTAPASTASIATITNPNQDEVIDI